MGNFSAPSWLSSSSSASSSSSTSSAISSWPSWSASGSRSSPSATASACSASRRAQTDYRISLLPWAATSSSWARASSSPAGTLEPDDFAAKTRWQRFLVIAMGPIMNILLAVVIVAGINMVGVSVARLPGPGPGHRLDRRRLAGRKGRPARRTTSSWPSTAGRSRPGPTSRWPSGRGPSGTLELEIRRDGADHARAPDDREAGPSTTWAMPASTARS